jgi:hypothetical protein
MKITINHDRHDRYLDDLRQAGIPQPPGENILDMRYIETRRDWYAKTEAGWFWFDRRGEGEWKRQPID